MQTILPLWGLFTFPELSGRPKVLFTFRLFREHPKFKKKASQLIKWRQLYIKMFCEPKQKFHVICDIYLCQMKGKHFQNQGIHQKQRKMIRRLCFCFPLDPVCSRKSPQKDLLQNTRQLNRLISLSNPVFKQFQLKKKSCYSWDSSFEIFDSTEPNNPLKEAPFGLNSNSFLCLQMISG